MKELNEYPEFMYLETHGKKIPNIVNVDGKKYLLTAYLGNSKYYYRNLNEEIDSLEIDFSKFTS